MKEANEAQGGFTAGMDKPNLGTCIIWGLIMDSLTTI